MSADEKLRGACSPLRALAKTLRGLSIDDRLRWLEACLRRALTTAAGRRTTPQVAALVNGRGAPEQTGGAEMTTPVECRYHGRDFTTEEMALRTGTATAGSASDS